MADEKLFPPILDSKLPAFTGNSLNIPFTMNKAVSFGDISKMSVIVKAAQTGKTIGTLTSSKPSENNGGFNANFSCASLNLQVGQYYKVQIAYINKSNVIGYYSSAGIIKKTASPDLEILEFKNDTTVSNKFEYTGHYSQKGTGKDSTEKVYSYQFTIKDLKENIIETSGELLHDNSKDESNNESVDTWSNNISLEVDQSYIFSYSITTINGYKKDCSYVVTVAESVDIDLDIDLETKLNYDDGSIELYLLPRKKNKSVITGTFVLVRSSSLNNFKIWDVVYDFTYINVMLNKDKPTLIWEDLSVHQGETYQYAIQAYNTNNLYSNRLEAKNGKIKADFENCFLTDAEHQLKISFNPKISSFKTNVVESKVNTLGSKYPYIFKNGFVDYKEFPISGLLSLLSDENGKFDLKYSQEKTQKRVGTPGAGEQYLFGNSLTSANVYNERQFKNEVLQWLNNGKPKMFRSATEGNFIVRLMNVSLAPNDTLGRMLHTFSCTAYEVEDFTFQNLKNQGLIFQPENKSLALRVGQIIPGDIMYLEDRETLYPSLSFFDADNIKRIGLPPSYAVSIVDAEPFTQFKLWFNNVDPEIIEIGSTGTYTVPIYKEIGDKSTTYIEEIEILTDSTVGNIWKDTKINFEYYDIKPFDTFSEICDIQLKSEIRRFVGPGYSRNLVEAQTLETNDYDKILIDLKRECGKFYFIRIEKRFVQEMWKVSGEDNKFSRIQTPRTDIILEDEWNSLTIYHDNVNDIYYDGHYSRPMSGEPDYRFCFNNNETDYSYMGVNKTSKSKERFSDSFGRIDSIRNVDKVFELRAGNGLFLDVGYRMRIKNYAIEQEELKEDQKYKNYIKAQQKLQKVFSDYSGDNANTELENAIQNLNRAYKEYIKKLNTRLEEKRRQE